MRNVANYSRGIGLAIPFMGGSWLPDSPHDIANKVQAANKGAPPLWVAEEALRKSGCRPEDVKIIMDELKEQINIAGWILP